VLPRILIGICSCHRYDNRRNAARATWLRALSPGTAAAFFVGVGESSDCADVVRLPVADDYQHLSTKVHCFYRYALEHYSFDFVLKCDDDTYVCVDRLVHLPREGVDFLGSEELDHSGFASGGAGYLLSRRMLEHVVRDPVGPRQDEDVVFSGRARASGLRCESSGLLKGFGNQFPEPCNAIITGHWCGPFEMVRVHGALTGEFPGAPLLELTAQHHAWSGSVRLYADGSFWSRGPSLPNGVWVADQCGRRLRLEWYHWPPTDLEQKTWGFEAPDLKLTFADPAATTAWERFSATASLHQPVRVG
jgi:hypothetical protein